MQNLHSGKPDCAVDESITPYQTVRIEKFEISKDGLDFEGLRGVHGMIVLLEGMRSCGSFWMM